MRLNSNTRQDTLLMALLNSTRKSLIHRILIILQIEM